MSELGLLHRLGVALAIGLIIGFERAWKTRDMHGGLRLAGIRTFALTGLFGGVAAALVEPASARGGTACRGRAHYRGLRAQRPPERGFDLGMHW